MAPLYRLRTAAGGYFYTSSEAERDAAVADYGFLAEGVAAWVETANPNLAKVLVIEWLRSGMESQAPFTDRVLLPMLTDGTRYLGHGQPCIEYTVTSIATSQGPPPTISNNPGGWEKAADQPGYLDMAAVFRERSLRARGLAGEFDLVIQWMDVRGDYGPKGAESYITGPAISGIQWLHGDGFCDFATIRILNLSYASRIGDALQSWGHHIEETFRTYEPGYAAWRRSLGITEGRNYLVHWPPGGRFEYDFAGPGAEAWGGTQEGYHVWWMQRVPPHWWRHLRKL